MTLINIDLQGPFKGSFTRNVHELNCHTRLEITLLESPTTSPRGLWVNSSPPSAAYMRQWTGSTLFQIMACRLVGAKPLSEPMLAIGLLGTNSSEIWIGILPFSFRKIHLPSATMLRGRWVKQDNPSQQLFLGQATLAAICSGYWATSTCARWD